jgi:hypothetical protein
VYDYGTGGINAAFDYSTLAEQRQGVVFLNNYCGNKTVNGSVAGVGASQFAAMHLGFDEDLAGGTAGDNLFQLQNVPLGPRDLVAALHDDATERVNRFILRRGVNAADNSTLPVIDFSAAESFAPASATATVTGLAGDVASVFTGLGTFYYPRLSQFRFEVTTSVPYDALPAAQLAPGDVQRLVGYAQNCCEPQYRTVDVYFRNVVDRTLAFGPAAATPTISTVTGSSFARPRIQMPVQPEYNRSIEAFFSQGTGASERSAYYRASSDYYATAPTTWDLTYPDVSAVAGFNTAWAFQPGATTSWTVFVFGGDFLPFEDATLPADGDAFRSAYREGGPFTALRRAAGGDASTARRGFGRAPLGMKR